MIKDSIIISYKESSLDRRLNLQRILRYLSNLLNDETEIVLVEQGDVSTIDWLDVFPYKENINHIFLKNTGIFNKGWGYNVGVNNSKGTKLIFNDIDVFLVLKRYIFSLNLLNHCDVVNPYNKIYFLDKENSKTFIDSEYNFSQINPESSYYLPNVISGGIFMMRKEKYLLLKGFDEECYGYGHEDDIFDMKIRKLQLSTTVIAETAAHIYHDVPKDDIYYSRKGINERLFSQYLTMSVDEIKNKINKTQFFGQKCN